MKSAHKEDICSCSPQGEGQILANRAASVVTFLLSRLSLVLIRAYQLTRHLRQPSCRFYPSCSQYTAVGIERFGFVRGLWLGCMRILRCHPWHPGGVDEVPTQFPGLFADLRSGIKVACEIPAGWTGWGQRTRGKR